MLVELRLDEPERQLGADHLADVDLPQQVRQPAHVILVRVGQHDGEHRAVDEVRDVREDEVDAEVLVAREREARVDHDPLVADLEHGHVLADLAEPAERDDAQCLHERSLSGDGLEQAETLEAAANLVGLRLVGLDERQAEPAHLVPEQLEGPLDRDRDSSARAGARSRDAAPRPARAPGRCLPRGRRSPAP